MRKEALHSMNPLLIQDVIAEMEFHSHQRMPYYAAKDVYNGVSVLRYASEETLALMARATVLTFQEEADEAIWAFTELCGCRTTLYYLGPLGSPESNRRGMKVVLCNPTSRASALHHIVRTPAHYLTISARCTALWLCNDETLAPYLDSPTYNAALYLADLPYDPHWTPPCAALAKSDSYHYVRDVAEQVYRKSLLPYERLVASKDLAIAIPFMAANRYRPEDLPAVLLDFALYLELR